MRLRWGVVLPGLVLALCPNLLLAAGTAPGGDTGALLEAMATERSVPFEQAGLEKVRPQPDCLDGTKYDDTKFEDGLRGALFNDNLVMLFEAPSYPARIDKICIAWRRTSFWKDIFYDIRIWAADGPDGSPGTLIDTITGRTAVRIPRGTPKFYNYDVSGYNIVVDGPVFIGPYWDPIEYFLIYLAMDTGRKTPMRLGYHNVGILDDQPPHTKLGPDSGVPQYRALGVRVKFSRYE